MITLSGTHTCRRCGKEYAWKDTELEHNEATGFTVTTGFKWDDARKNVRNATLNAATGLYTVEVSCPYCGCTEFEEAKPQ